MIWEAHLTRAFNSIEWGLKSPPNPHAFTSLPVQSTPYFSQFLLEIGHDNLWGLRNNKSCFIVIKGPAADILKLGGGMQNFAIVSLECVFFFRPA